MLIKNESDLDPLEGIERDENLVTRSIFDEEFGVRYPGKMANSTPEEAPVATPETSSGEHVQWALAGNDRFVPVGHTRPKLPAGVYETFINPSSWGLERLNIQSDGIYELPDMATNVVLEEAEKFWASEANYRKHNLLYKRGLILFGPAGGGKTVALKLLMNKLIARDGVVILVSNVNVALMCLKALRRIEPNRNLITVFEDIDEILNLNGESAVLSMLDGENNIDRVLNLATTNYPDRLGARIINRPSRFDRRVEVGMPGNAAREMYLRKATNEALDAETLARWVADTDKLSIAHLRELVAAVYCLDQPYADVIQRLQSMVDRVKTAEEFRDRKTGFITASPRRSFVNAAN